MAGEADFVHSLVGGNLAHEPYAFRRGFAGHAVLSQPCEQP